MYCVCATRGWSESPGANSAPLARPRCSREVTTIKREADERVKEFLEQQEAALEVADVVEARKLLERTRPVLVQLSAWRELRTNEPESYKQLSDKLEAAAKLLSLSSKTELGQLRKVFEWCRDHGIELAELKVKQFLPRYREAACYLYRLCYITEMDDGTRLREVQEALERIRSERNRQAVRAWVRRPGQQGKKFDV